MPSTYVYSVLAHIINNEAMLVCIYVLEYLKHNSFPPFLENQHI